MKNRILTLLGLLLIGYIPATAATSAFAGNKNAWQYAYGVNPNVPALQVISGSTLTSASYTITLAYGYVALSDGSNLNPISVLAPIIIGGGSAQETVTPTSVSCSTPQSFGTCTITATFTNAHGNGDQVRSGTAGLQEAIDFVATQNGTSAGGLVSVDSTWAANGGTNALITAAVGFHYVALEDNRFGQVQYWNLTQGATTVLAAPTTLISTTVASNLGAAAGIAGSASWGSTVHACIAYVDVEGNEGPCSADYSFTSVVSQAIGWTAPAASTGAVGWVAYLSLSGGTYALAYRVPTASMNCTTTKVETVTAACAVANTTYGQSGSTAFFTSYPVNTARIWVGLGGTSSTSDYVGNSNGRTTYAYAPSAHLGLPGFVTASLPFHSATAPATTVPAVIGTVTIPAGSLNYVGSTIRICGLMTEASAGSTSTIATLEMIWDADGSNTAGAGVILGGPTITATMVTSNADQLSFCEDLKTTVSGASTTAGSILAGYGYLAESYGAATTVSAASGPTIGAAAVGSLNLAGEARIDVTYVHTTGTDGAAPILQDLTVERIN